MKICCYLGEGGGAAIACWESAGLVIERLRVRILAGAVGKFSSVGVILCANSHSVSLPSYAPALAGKDTGHSAKSAGGTSTPLTQRSRSVLTMPLFRHSVGTYQETSSHANRQGTFGHSRLSSLSHSLSTDPGLKSGISVCKLISHEKKIPPPPKKKRKKKSAALNLLPKSSQARKNLPPTFKTISKKIGLGVGLCKW